MANSGCATCKLRARYDNNRQSLLGRLWRWHAGWCPGWKSYMTSLSEGEREALAQQYDMPKFKASK